MKSAKKNMRCVGTTALSVIVMMLLLTVISPRSAAEDYPYPPGGWEYGSPQFLDRIGQVLNAIDTPSERSTAAQNWLQFAKTVIARNLELRQQWLDVQKQQLEQNQQAAQENMEIAKLQLQIQQLRAENVQMERENLQMQAKLMKKGGGQTAPQPATAEPNQPAAAVSKSSGGS